MLFRILYVFHIYFIVISYLFRNYVIFIAYYLKCVNQFTTNLQAPRDIQVTDALEANGVSVEATRR